MIVSQGTKLGPYEVISPLGAGGMGEVYKARDSRLNRIVAIKVLSQKLSSDPEAQARFEREARLIAGLNHPHICTLHDVGQHDGAGYLVMEFLEGQNLAERLKKGPLPIEEALKVATEIADALEKAHAHGIFHRDLKPGNIMLTPTGAKLLDFGLAKLTERGAGGGSANLSSSPTIADELTGEGKITGTLQYMAPEQLEGRLVDARADIFSFGTVLYEMLTGRKAFEAATPAGRIAAILKSEPVPVSSLEPSVAPVVDQLISGCLSKNREDRWQTIHDVAKQLRWIAAMPSSRTATAPKRNRTKWIFGAAAAVVAVAAIAAALLQFARPGGRVETAEPARLTVTFPDTVIFSVGEYPLRSAIISPDGRRIVFTGVDRRTGRSALYVRLIDSTDASLLEGTSEGTDPFWSPDSQSIGFLTGGKLERTDLQGGTPQLIQEGASGGGSWNKDGIILASLKKPGPLFRLSASGGQAAPVTELDPTLEVDHDSPQFTSDGKHFLYLAQGRTQRDSAVYVASLDSKQRKLLLKGVGTYVYAHPNHVLFLRAGTVMAQQFDVEKAILIGQPVPLAEKALAPLSASQNGVITYRTLKPTPNPLLWIKRDGTEIGSALPSGYYVDPVISPDGSRLAFAAKESEGAKYEIWILEFASGMRHRLTVDSGDDRSPTWSPDGQEIIFVSFRPTSPGLYRKSANGAGAESLIAPATNVIWPYQWPEKNTLLYFGGITGANDILKLPLDTLKPEPLVNTPFNEVDGSLSPDGKWLAYISNESGRYEMYVTTYPPSSTKIPVTTTGGTDPIWSKDGREIFFLNSSTTELLSVSVKPGNPPEFSMPRRVHPGPFDYATAHSFDLDLKNGRILVAPSSARLGDINVLLNWPSLAKNAANK